jgi:hypothetical protein
MVPTNAVVSSGVRRVGGKEEFVVPESVQAATAKASRDRLKTIGIQNENRLLFAMHLSPGNHIKTLFSIFVFTGEGYQNKKNRVLANPVFKNNVMQFVRFFQENPVEAPYASSSS